MDFMTIIVLQLSVLWIIVSTELVCNQQNAWIHEPSQKCFWVFETKGDPVSGSIGCQQRGGHLATINSLDISQFIGIQTIEDTFFYMGVHDSGNGNWCGWNNDTPVQWTNWASDQPDGNIRSEEQPCVIVQKSDMKWFDMPCENVGLNEHVSLCESEASVLETTTTLTATEIQFSTTTTTLKHSTKELDTSPEQTTNSLSSEMQSTTDVGSSTRQGRQTFERRSFVKTHCTCRCTVSAKSSSNLTAAIESIVRKLKIDVTETSKHRTRYESASDDRPSAKATGVLGIVITSVFFLLIMALDLIRT